MDQWTVAYKRKIKDAVHFLECINNLTPEDCQAALEATRNLLCTAIVILTSNRFQVKNILLTEGQNDEYVSFGEVVQSGLREKFIARKDLRVVLTNVLQDENSPASDLVPIKTEREDDEDYVPSMEDGDDDEEDDKAFQSSLAGKHLSPVSSGDVHFSGQRKLIMSHFECYICGAKASLPKFKADTEAALGQHLRESHIVKDQDGCRMPCLFCCKSYVFDQRHLSTSALCESYARLFGHIMEAHATEGFQKPAYIKEIQCTQCPFTAYTMLVMKYHMKRQHRMACKSVEAAEALLQQISDQVPASSVKLRRGKRLLQKDGSEAEGDGTRMKKMRGQKRQSCAAEVDGMAREKLVFLRFECFICLATSKETEAFDSEDGLMSHMLALHVISNSSAHWLDCIYCSGPVCSWFGDVSCLSEKLVEYVQHLHQEHPNEYVMPDCLALLECPTPDCPFSALSLPSMREHLSSEHNLPMEVEEMIKTHFPDLCELIETLSPRKRRRKATRDSRASALDQSGETEDSSDPIAGFFRPFSEGRAEEVNRKAAISHMNDRQIALTEYRCFLCADMDFDDPSALKNHWREGHFKFRNDFATLNCQFRDQEYTIRRKKLVPCNAAELMSRYCQHLMNKHQKSIPDYILRVKCPLEGCSKVFFNLHYLRVHLKSHGVHSSSEEIKCGLFRIPYEDASSLTFINYQCFICLDGVDHVSSMGYVNHWLGQHLQLHMGYWGVCCVHCHEYTLSTLKGSELRANHLMALIVSHLEHLMKAHQVTRPTYVAPPKEIPDVNDAQVVSEAEATPLMHRPCTKRQIAEAISMGDRRILLTSLCCLLCQGGSEFADEKALCQHFLLEHSQVSESVHFCHCPYCTHQWQIRSSTYDVLEAMMLLCKHLYKNHANEYPLPSFVRTLSCLWPNCHKTFFCHNGRKIHMVSHGLRPSTDPEFTNAFTLPVQPTHPVFSEYRCFTCDNAEDLGSVLSLLQHYITVHCAQVTRASLTSLYQMTCNQCDESFMLTPKQAVKADDVMTALGAYLRHQVEKHARLCPPYVLQLPEQVGPKPSKNRRRSRLLLSDGARDHQLALRVLRCFQCDGDEAERVWPTRRAFFEHWMAEHAQSDMRTVTVQCKLCTHAYTPGRHGFSMGRFFELLGRYARHLVNAHGLELADCVLRCPVACCSFQALMPAEMRTHMEMHGIGGLTTHQLTQGEIDLSIPPDGILFERLVCYICPGNPPSFESHLDFLNHFLQEHFQPQLRCSDCTDACFSLSDPVLLPEVWGHIGALIMHRLSAHGMKVPDYLHRFTCAASGCKFEALRERDFTAHVQVHLGALAGQHILHYEQLRCFGCEEDGTVFGLEEELAQHWVRSHMQQTNCTLSLNCTACGTSIQAELDGAPGSILEMVTVYLQHVMENHAFQPPSYVVQHMCYYSGCGFSTPLPKALVAHVDQHHREGVASSSGSMDKGMADEPAKEDGDVESIYTRRPLEILLKSLICFLCDENQEYGDTSQLTAHILSQHCVEQDVSFTLPCLYCWKKYSIASRAKTPGLILQTCGSLIQHMAERHEYTAPDFVTRVRCPQEGCDYTTFTTDRLASHLKIFHAIVDAKLGRFKNKSFQKKLRKDHNLTSKTIFKMRQYKCFECEQGLLEFNTFQEYSKHWREAHYTLEGNVFAKKCRMCDHVYKVPRKKGLESSGLLESVSFYFMHLVNKHKMAPPDYVVPYPCEVAGCEFVTYTLYSLEIHCKNKHKVLHSDLVAQMEQQPSLPERSVACIQDCVQFQVHLDFPSAPADAHFVQQILPAAGQETYQMVSLPVAEEAELSSVVEQQQPLNFMCFKCGRDFTSAESRKRHIQEEHEGVRKHLCHVCPATFRSLETFQEHLFKAHQISKNAFYCDQCDFSTAFQSKLERHMFRKHQPSAAGQAAPALA